MISILEIINFQAWKNAILEFHKDVNIIKGTSHHGKSSLIRAFDWIFRNKPINDDMRPWSDPKKKLEISGSVEFDDGHYISRIKTKTFNGYETSIGPFEALHRKMPEEIVNLANMRENIHMQDDDYFLLKESPGNVARILNRKSGLEDIDIIAKATKSAIADLVQKKKTTESKKDETQEELTKLNKLAKLAPKFKELDKLIETRDHLEKTENGIRKLLNDIKLIRYKINDVKHFLKFEKSINEIQSLTTNIYSQSQNAEKLRELLEDIDANTIIMTELQSILEFKKSINEIQSLITDLEEIESERKILEVLIGQINIISKQIVSDREKIIQLKRKKKLLEVKLNYCPECGAYKKYWRKNENINSR